VHTYGILPSPTLSIAPSKTHNNTMRLSLGINGFEVYAIPIEVSMLLEKRLRQWCSDFRINVAQANFEFMTKESRSTE
jgi:hypothetical protein